MKLVKPQAEGVGDAPGEGIGDEVDVPGNGDVAVPKHQEFDESFNGMMAVEISFNDSEMSFNISMEIESIIEVLNHNTDDENNIQSPNTDDENIIQEKKESFISIEEFRKGWNGHKIRYEGHMSPSQIWMSGMLDNMSSGYTPTSELFGVNPSIGDKLDSGLQRFGLTLDDVGLEKSLAVPEVQLK
ncbi:unnamed protein product [Mytilus edulis]|uniref:Integrase core domain-containing protein n=1 Tax=Mytilus edulis TaxID=6550 RepID=A0A8S3SCP4_MYTED|nr:unnamed protein product [Mytilus edulis]